MKALFRTASTGKESVKVQSRDFHPDDICTQQRSSSPMPRRVLHAILILFATLLIWVCLGRLDIVALAQGKLVPQGYLKIVQPAEPGIVHEILVREGQEVRAGQVLVRMDRRAADADGRALFSELQRKRLQLRRIESELGEMPLQRQADDPPDIYERAEAQLGARLEAHRDALAAEQATLVKAQHDLRAALEIEAKYQKRSPIFKEQADSWNTLAARGFAGRLMALERQRAQMENEQDLRAQTQNVAGLRALIAQSERRIAQIVSGYRQQLQNERVETAALYHKLQQDWDKQQHRLSLLELKAPQAAIIKELATHTPGTVVAPGTILLTLVPRDEPLVAEVWVDNLDAGFVQSNQKARIKIAAYPFQKYGLLEGVVKQVGADAQAPPDTSSPALRAKQDAVYRALIGFDSRYFEGRSGTLRLVPGMQVSAEIHLGTRTVLEYLLSPVQKVVHEAGRER